jgi:hypothetical protein
MASLSPAIIYRRCRCYQLFIIAGVVVTGDKLLAGVMESMKSRARHNHTGNIFLLVTNKDAGGYLSRVSFLTVNTEQLCVKHKKL